MKKYRDAGKVGAHGKLKSMVGTHAAGSIKGPTPPVDPAYETLNQIPKSGPVAKVGKGIKPAFADGGAVLPGDAPPVSRLDRPGRGKPGATVNVIVAPGPGAGASPPPPPGPPMPTPPPMPPMGAGGGGPPPPPVPPPGGGGAPGMMNRGGRAYKAGGGVFGKKMAGGKKA